MIILFTLFILFTCSQINTLAQVPDTVWTKTYGFNGSDWGLSVKQAKDRGYILTGCTNSSGAGNYDFALIKTDPNGNIGWFKTFGGPGADYGHYVEQTSDGGYIITGITYSFGAGSADVWLVKTDSVGNIEWNKAIGLQSGDYGRCVQQTTDGGFIITGFSYSFSLIHCDVALLKTDLSGNTKWLKNYGGSDDDDAFSVKQTSDGGFIITGSTLSFGNAGSSNVWLIKTDSLGNTLWNKSYGGTDNDIGRSVEQTSDGGYIISGYANSFSAGDSDVGLLKTDSEGNLQWIKTFGGEKADGGECVCQTSDGGYIITGFTDSYGAGNTDVWILKTDSNGFMEWSKTVGGPAIDWGYSIQQTIDGGYIIVGYTYSYGAGGRDVFIIKLDEDYTDVNDKTDIENYKLYQNYPNPFNPTTKIKYSIPITVETYGYGSVHLKVYDVLGREITTLVNEKKQPGEYEVEFNATNLPSGIYFYQLKTGDFIQIKKMILLK